MPTIVPFNCYSSNQSTQTALPRPWPCCGWKVAPASFSGLYYCTSMPMLCGGIPTTSTPFTLPRTSDCGSVYTYSSITLPFYITASLFLCTEPTGASPPGSISVGIGPIFVPTVGPTCSKIGSTYNFYLEGNLTYGSAQIRIIVNQVTP